MSLPKDVQERDFYVCIAEKKGKPTLYFDPTWEWGEVDHPWETSWPEMFHDYDGLKRATKGVPNPVVFGFGTGYVIRIIKVRLQFIEECR